ncbi:MAG: LPS assembly lipoprotein LptE [Elusimicrobiota bacterium]|nr:LPS assembly lipoprotein LptE [Elusimicrobiota bacterium]
MRRLLPLVSLALAAACGTDVAYRPTPQLLPQNIQRLAIRPIVNKSQQFGLEDKLALRVRDEFLRDGRYPVSPESEASGAVAITITRYILTAVQYDSTLAPTAYKLRVLVDVSMVDIKANQVIWEERNLESSLNYPAATLRGGLTEEQAREQIWDILARAIVKRTVYGFGSVTGTSERRITGDAPSTDPVAKPQEPLKPVVNTPY